MNAQLQKYADGIVKAKELVRSFELIINRIERAVANESDSDFEAALAQATTGFDEEQAAMVTDTLRAYRYAYMAFISLWNDAPWAEARRLFDAMQEAKRKAEAAYVWRTSPNPEYSPNIY